MMRKLCLCFLFFVCSLAATEVMQKKVTIVEIGSIDALPSRAATFLIVKLPDGKLERWHIGPTSVVAEMIRALTVGQEITGFVFLDERGFVVKEIISRDQDIEFRDAELKSIW